MDTERPARPSEADWAAVSTRLGANAATATGFAYWRALALVLLLTLLGGVAYLFSFKQTLRLEQEELVRTLAVRDAELTELRAENARLTGALTEASQRANATQAALERSEELQLTLRNGERALQSRLTKLQNRLVASESALQELRTIPVSDFAPLAQETPGFFTREIAADPDLPVALLSEPLLGSGQLSLVRSAYSAAPQLAYEPRELPKERIPLIDRMRHTGTFLNLGGSAGFPEIITSSETLSALALSAGGRFEYGVGAHLRVLAGVDFWKISYGGLNVRYFPEFLDDSLQDHLNALQTPRHFLSTQRMQRFTLGLKYLPRVRGDWQPYLAANASLERARTERLLYVVYDDLLNQNVLFNVSENYLTRTHSDRYEWVSVELRPGLTYRIADRLGASAELYYAFPFDAGKREARFAPRAGLRLGVSYRVF